METFYVKEKNCKPHDVLDLLLVFTSLNANALKSNNQMENNGIIHAQLEVMESEQNSGCRSLQRLTQLCRCCKVNCWYTIADLAAHTLGHIPGERGEDETLTTLQLIRACMIQKCKDICVRKTTKHNPRMQLLRLEPFSNQYTDNVKHFAQEKQLEIQ